MANQTFGPSKIHIPKAPALGLLLEQPRFGVYNVKVDENNAAAKVSAEKAKTKAGEDGVLAAEGGADDSAANKAQIDFERHRQAIDDFKKEHIYSVMRREEGQHRM